MGAALGKLKIAVHNLLVPFSFVVFFVVVFPFFLWSINKHRGKHSGKGLRIPRCIHVNTRSEAPAGLIVQWRKYGIRSIGVDGMVKDHDGIIERNTFFWVAPEQHWMATRIVWAIHYQYGTWHPITDSYNEQGLVASKDAEKGIWAPSGAEPPLRFWWEGTIVSLGRILGMDAIYTDELMKEPGIRNRAPELRGSTIFPERARPVRPARPARPKRRRR